MKNTNHHSSSLRVLAILISLIGMTIFTGCNTISGLGEDTESAGESIQDAAN